MSTPTRPVCRNVNAPFKSPLRSIPVPPQITEQVPEVAVSRTEQRTCPNTSSNEQATRDEISRLTKQLLQMKGTSLDVDHELAMWRTRMHCYNEAKDACLQLFELLAHAKGCPVRDLYEQYGLDVND